MYIAGYNKSLPEYDYSMTLLHIFPQEVFSVKGREAFYMRLRSTSDSELLIPAVNLETAATEMMSPDTEVHLWHNFFGDVNE